MNLYVLRHGDAIEHGYEDFARPLSLSGKEQAKLAAHTLKTLNVTVPAAFSSTLERAKQTASIIVDEMKISSYSATEHLVPGSDHRKLLEIINQLKEESVLLVGHEPHLTTLISILINGTSYSHIALRKGTMLCIETPAPIERGKGTLRWMFTPEEMRYLQK